MPWVRIHDGALGHPKIAGIVELSHPFTLWVWGLSHSQMHLTDGIIVRETLPKRAWKTAAELVRRRLWEEHPEGWLIHDFVKWNDSRETVEERKEESRRRKEEWKARRNSVGTCSERVPNGNGTAVEQTPNQTKPNQPTNKKEQEREKSVSLSPAALKFSDPKRDPFTDAEVTERAGRFVERYQELYIKHRNGARYAVKPVRDYAAAVTLCLTWADDRLDRLAVIFLTTDHKFAEEGSRTIPQFLALASWADGRLAEHEAKKGSAA